MQREWSDKAECGSTRLNLTFRYRHCIVFCMQCSLHAVCQATESDTQLIIIVIILGILSILSVNTTNPDSYF